ncbi:MAG: nucleotidyl transferase AbiEii/AbiGii toxin family protein [Acidobacteria bacterium]|nr:nucleotidyl transferase AbiEii/AbiGii toxin family protein [Acidobacteriota bacterium]
MAEAFLSLARNDQADALGVAADRSGRPVHLLQKDVWVVWALETLAGAPFGPHLVFKGGTSLSKAYQAIARFSEDVDLTYDIRAIAPDLAEPGSDGLPQSQSQEQKWTKTIRTRLRTWTRDEVVPTLERRLSERGLAATVVAHDVTATITYEPLATGTGYVSPVVLLEFGARSTGEPSEPRLVTCDAAPYLPDVTFPSATPAVMRPERTFWEKATAIHVFCRGGRLRGDDRFSRHWSDIVAMDRHGHVNAALADRGLADRVGRHKNVFFREKDGAGAHIDYATAVRGHLQLVPHGDRLQALADDYARMVDDRLFFDTPPTFESVIERCRDIQQRANGESASRATT